MSPPGPRRLRVLVAFLALGGALAALGRAVPSAPPELVVHVPSGASPSEIAHAIDDAALVELGVELGWKTDPLIVDALARGLGFIGLAGDRQGLLDRAAGLDLPRRDPLARARLMERARAILSRVPEPTRVELEAFHRDHAARFRRPAMVTLAHELLGAGPPDLALGPRATRSEDQLARLFGPEVTRAIMALPPTPAGAAARWSDPMRTPLGVHRFAVLAIAPAAIPSLDAIHDEVVGAWRESRRTELLAAGLARLRARHTIRVVEAAP